MKMFRLVLIGFGNVGQGLAEILRDRGAWLAERFGVRFVVVGVADLYKGSLYDPAGLDVGMLVTAVQRDGHLKEVDAPHKGWTVEQLIAESEADAVVEMSFTDLQTGQPATDYIRLALGRGKHVATTNKGPIALHYGELARLAAENGVRLAAEGTVMSGTPALHLGSQVLLGAGITRVQGILNGTTNYILTQMAAGTSYAEALAEAQARGFAEADPTGDVEGVDAAGKVVILANLLLDGSLTMGDVTREGITRLTVADVAAAEEAGERWKLIGTAVRHDDGRIEASVKPVRLPLSHPLAQVSGATNAITYSTELLGEVTLIGAGAGRLETGYALIEDLLAIGREDRGGR